MKTESATLELALAFHRRIAAIIAAVQEGIWMVGRQELIGYDSDFGFGQRRGVQSLVLKTTHRSAYVRLDWDTLVGASPDDQQRIDDSIRGAILALS